jgi:hypothetical protein
VSEKDPAIPRRLRKYMPGGERMACPHCQKKGEVFTWPVSVKRGISGGKAAAAILTAGISVLFVGLSRREELTEARRENCEARWKF